MKKTALMLAIVLGVCAAQPLAVRASEGQLADVQAAGKMVVGLEGNWAPWSFHDESDALVGFDADVARAIAEKIGVEAEIVEGPWESLFAGLDAGRYDVVVNGVEITEERTQKYDFSEPYAYIHTALIVRTDNEEIRSFEDLEGKKTVNSLASTYMDLAESYGAEALGVSTLDETLENVINKRADATLNATVSFYDYMSVHPDAPLKIVALTEDASEVAIPLRKGEEAFRSAVDEAILTLREEGTLKELSEKYFGEDISGTAEAAAPEEGEAAGQNAWAESLLQDQMVREEYPYFCLLDVDQDGRSELFLSTTEDSFIGFEDKAKLTALVDEKAADLMEIGQAGGDSFRYNSDSKSLYHYSRISGEKHFVEYTLDKGVLTETASADSYEPHHGPGETDNENELYYVNGEEVFAEAFEEAWSRFEKAEEITFAAE